MKMRIMAGALALATVVGCNDDTDGGGGSGGAAGSSGSTTNKADQPLVAGSRLKVRQATGTDGSVQQLGLFDTELGATCSFTTADDGSTRCLPNEAYAGDFWSDPQCTVPLGLSPCAIPKFVTVRSPACGVGQEVHQAAELYTGTVYFGQPMNGCSQQGTGEGRGLYATTGKLAASQFVEGAIETK